MNANIKRAILAAAVTSIAVSVIFGTPEVITQAVLFVIPFIITLTVLLVFLRRSSVAAWSLARQRAVTWGLAVCISVFVGLLLFPPTLHFLIR
jgi:ABC-type uncharacterized transport system permease subunit